jgi:hypothetical protein
MQGYVDIAAVQIYRDVEGNGQPITCKGMLMNLTGEITEKTQQVVCIDDQNKPQCYKCPARRITAAKVGVARNAMVERHGNAFRLGEIPV